MAKQPERLFPQRVQVVNLGLHRAVIAADVAEVHTDLGVLRVPLAWWKLHRDDPAYVITVTAVEAAPRHHGSGREESA